jgi:O-antigen/teichoic acid export membrane protein
MGFFTAIFIRRFLGPLNMGIWGILKVVSDYASYNNLGSTSAIPYKLPVLKGQGKTDEVKKLTSVIFNFVTIVTFICSIAIVVYALIFLRTLPREIFIGLLVVSVMLLSQRVYTYYMMLLRANKDFGILSKSVFFDAVTNLGLVLLIVSRFKLYGFYFVIIIMPVINVWFIRKYVTYNLAFNFHVKGILAYIKYGLPLFLTGMLDQILYSIDRIMIVSMLGLEQLGFYSIALMTRNYGTGLSKNFSIVIQPHFMEDFGKNGIEKSCEYVIRYCEVSAYFMSIVLSIVFIIAYPFVYFVLPSFLPGVTAMKIFLLATFFLTLSPYPNNFLVAVEKQSRLIPITVMSILINVVFNYLFIRKGYGINGVSAATAISACVSFFVVSIYALSHTQNLSGIIKYFSKVFFPLVYCLLCLWGIHIWIRHPNQVWEALIGSFLFIALTAPLVIYINKKTTIINVLFEIVLKKIKNRK